MGGWTGPAHKGFNLALANWAEKRRSATLGDAFDHAAAAAGRATLAFPVIDAKSLVVPAVDGVGQETPGHTTHWLPNGILIIEMLTNLQQLSLRSLFVATPLKIKEGSGSPIRPVAFCES